MDNFLNLVQDSATGNYILQNLDAPILCPFQYIQVYPATIWTIVHNRNSMQMVVQVYINNKLVKTNPITFVDKNTIQIIFPVAVSGFLNAAVYTTNSNCVPLPTLSPTPTITPTTSPTPSTTPTLSASPTPTLSATPTLTITPTPTLTRTPTPSPS